ncbi:unnamed protein product [Clonostachys solani]|uniref:Uncharacterized protein n=1 Tax=Clonostachys solani TaxID=160281 RepID=A0A9N9ZAT5_9HYPO|nr:unnamed protein product [Clonostachys solani]
MINPRTTKPGPIRFAIPVVATAAIGTALYYRTRTSSNKTPTAEELRKQRSSEGLSGAGLAGSDFPSGGAHKDVPHTNASPRELPSSGAIGAGEGGGNTNVRAVDMFQGPPSSGTAYSSSQTQRSGVRDTDKASSSATEGAK